MSKKYSKPDIIFESFSLCTGIASCEIKNPTPANAECAFTYDGVNFFTATVAACRPENGGFVVEDTLNNGFCYHVPLETNNIFGS